MPPTAAAVSAVAPFRKVSWDKSIKDIDKSTAMNLIVFVEGPICMNYYSDSKSILADYLLYIKGYMKRVKSHKDFHFYKSFSWISNNDELLQNLQQSLLLLENYYNAEVDADDMRHHHHNGHNRQNCADRLNYYLKKYLVKPIKTQLMKLRRQSQQQPPPPTTTATVQASTKGPKALRKELATILTIPDLSAIPHLIRNDNCLMQQQQQRQPIPINFSCKPTSDECIYINMLKGNYYNDPISNSSTTSTSTSTSESNSSSSNHIIHSNTIVLDQMLFFNVANDILWALHGHYVEPKAYILRFERFIFNNKMIYDHLQNIWKKINKHFCTSTSNNQIKTHELQVLWVIPKNEQLMIKNYANHTSFQYFNVQNFISNQIHTYRTLLCIFTKGRILRTNATNLTDNDIYNYLIK